MTQTTLTRELLFTKARVRYEVVDVPQFGTVGIRSRNEYTKARRTSQLFDANGDLLPEQDDRRRVYRLIDQLMIDETTPMFVDADADALGALDGDVLDNIFAAILHFDRGDDDTKKKDELNDLSGE
ncbi:MAG TPA: hypothetical protein VMX74_01760 [Pirellulales bacterium]|nr:hypothetical protein [Pirellulales bacterium]